jgi:hypothetical protein
MVVVDSSLMKFGTSLLFAMYIIVCPKMTFSIILGRTHFGIYYIAKYECIKFQLSSKYPKIISHYNILLPFVPFYKLLRY